MDFHNPIKFWFCNSWLISKFNLNGDSFQIMTSWLLKSKYRKYFPNFYLTNSLFPVSVSLPQLGYSVFSGIDIPDSIIDIVSCLVYQECQALGSRFMVREDQVSLWRGKVKLFSCITLLDCMEKVCNLEHWDVSKFILRVFRVCILCKKLAICCYCSFTTFYS